MLACNCYLSKLILNEIELSLLTIVSCLPVRVGRQLLPLWSLPPSKVRSSLLSSYLLPSLFSHSAFCPPATAEPTGLRGIWSISVIFGSFSFDLDTRCLPRGNSACAIWFQKLTLIVRENGRLDLLCLWFFLNQLKSIFIILFNQGLLVGSTQ